VSFVVNYEEGAELTRGSDRSPASGLKVTASMISTTIYKLRTRTVILIDRREGLAETL
jgi:hypothetical protein